jgi:hypothetical protein
LLFAELWALTERASVGLLSDEADPLGLQLLRNPFQSLGCAREVTTAQIARPRRRSRGSVRDSDAVSEELELLSRLEQARRESGRMQEAPEIVARIRKVSARSSRHAAGIDPAEEHPQARAENVRDG